MRKYGKFLLILWTLVISSFLLFQNFTTDVSTKTLHNESCRQSFELNDSRILNLNRAQAEVLGVRADEASSLNSTFTPVAVSLIETNRQLYSDCVAEKQILNSHLSALSELQILTNTEKNRAWKSYAEILNSSIKK